MTIVAAIGDGKSVWMIGDGLGNDSNERTYHTHSPKVFKKRNRFIIGMSGSHLACQLVERLWEPSDEWVGDKVGVMWRVRDSIWKLLHAEDVWPLVKREGTELMEGNVIVGYRGQVWNIGVDGTVDSFPHNYFAIGSGCEVGFGVLHATQDIGMEPVERLQRTLRACEFHLAGIGGTPTLEEIHG